MTFQTIREEFSDDNHHGSLDIRPYTQIGIFFTLKLHITDKFECMTIFAILFGMGHREGISGKIMIKL